MFKYLLLLILVSADYYTCDSLGNACKVGTTCCKKSGGKYGCCPIKNAICCSDDEGHCCPLGFPICDVYHKQCKNHLQQVHEFLEKPSNIYSDYQYEWTASIKAEEINSMNDIDEAKERDLIHETIEDEESKFKRDNIDVA